MTTAKLKALVWREWRICQKAYLTGLMVVIIMVLFFGLFRLSMSVGNLAPAFEGSEMLAQFSALLYYMSSAFVAAITACLSLDVTALQADIRANWLRYSFALPISPELRATSIYIVKYIKFGIGFAIAVVNGIVSAKIANVAFSEHMMWLFAAIMALVMLYDLLLQHFYAKARTIKGISAAQFTVMGVLTACMMGFMFYKTINEEANAETTDSLDITINSLCDKFISHENVIIPLTVIVLIAAPLLGWYITVRHYRMYGDVKEDTQSKKRFSLHHQKETKGDAES